MRDKGLFILLALTVAYILYVRPARDNSALLETQLTVLDSQIATQEAVRAKRKEIDSQLKSVAGAAKTNEGFLYPPKQSNSLVMVDLQDMVKTAATATNMQMVSSTWGEPVVDSTTGQTRFPMSFSAKGAPADLDAFLGRLLYARRFIKVERATITKSQDQQLLLTAALTAFKQDGKP